MDWSVAIAQNLLSDVIFIFISIAAGWLYLTVSGRRKLSDFFGVRKSRRIVIYLSRIGVIEGGAIGIDGKQRSYSGFTAALGEVQGANLFRQLFEYLLPTLSDDIPNFLRKLFIDDVDVEITHSPGKMSELDTTVSFITLGSPAYNVASRYVEETLQSQARFKLGHRILPNKQASKQIPERQVGLATATASTSEFEDNKKPESTARISTVTDTSSDNVTAQMWYTPNNILDTADTPEDYADSVLETIPTSIQLPDVSLITDLYQGFVERIVDDKSRRSVFYVAGISEFATQGAAYYLATQWKRLAKDYKKGTPFLIWLCFDQNDFKCVRRKIEIKG